MEIRNRPGCLTQQKKAPPCERGQLVRVLYRRPFRAKEFLSRLEVLELAAH